MDGFERFFVSRNKGGKQHNIDGRKQFMDQPKFVVQLRESTFANRVQLLVEGERRLFARFER